MRNLKEDLEKILELERQMENGERVEYAEIEWVQTQLEGKEWLERAIKAEDLCLELADALEELLSETLGVIFSYVPFSTPSGKPINRESAAIDRAAEELNRELVEALEALIPVYTKEEGLHINLFAIAQAKELLVKAKEEI